MNLFIYFAHLIVGSNYEKLYLSEMEELISKFAFYELGMLCYTKLLSYLYVISILLFIKFTAKYYKE